MKYTIDQNTKLHISDRLWTTLHQILECKESSVAQGGKNFDLQYIWNNTGNPSLDQITLTMNMSSFFELIQTLAEYHKLTNYTNTAFPPPEGVV